MRISATVQINAPLPQTFALFTDFTKLPQILHSAHFVEFKSSQQSGVGAKWEQRTGDLDNPTVALHSITQFSEPNSFTMISDDSAAIETLHFNFQPLGSNQTQVTMTIEAAAKGCLVAILAPMLKKGISQAMQEDLERMKEYVESQN